jgi:hypothetical protein
MEHLKNGPKGEYLTGEAIRVMDEFSKKEKPWLMYMSYYTVHAPFHVKAEKTKKYQDKAQLDAMLKEHGAKIPSPNPAYKKK